MFNLTCFTIFGCEEDGLCPLRELLFVVCVTTVNPGFITCISNVIVPWLYQNLTQMHCSFKQPLQSCTSYAQKPTTLWEVTEMITVEKFIILAHKLVTLWYVIAESLYYVSYLILAVSLGTFGYTFVHGKKWNAQLSITANFCWCYNYHLAGWKTVYFDRQVPLFQNILLPMALA
jgi:hypothetical protein